MGEKELGGFVYRGADGKFYAQPGVRGSGDHIPRRYTGAVGTVYGDWHDHGDYSKRNANGDIVRTDKHGDIFNSNHFSKDDTDIADTGLAREKTPYKSYLGTPDRSVKEYDPKTGEETDVTPGKDKANNQGASSPPGNSNQNEQGNHPCAVSRGGCGSGGGLDGIWGQ